jgi:hypothetical protein
MMLQRDLKMLMGLAGGGNFNTARVSGKMLLLSDFLC